MSKIDSSLSASRFYLCWVSFILKKALWLRERQDSIRLKKLHDILYVTQILHRLHQGFSRCSLRFMFNSKVQKVPNYTLQSNKETSSRRKNLNKNCSQKLFLSSKDLTISSTQNPKLDHVIHPRYKYLEIEWLRMEHLKSSDGETQYDTWSFRSQ